MNMSLCLNAAVVLLLCYFHRTKGDQSIEISVERKLKVYGENLLLFCKIYNCCPAADAGWNVDNVTLFTDLNTLHPNIPLKDPRYKVSNNATGILVDIQDFCTSDLNKTHECIYGVHKANLTLYYNAVFLNRVNDQTPDLSLIACLYFCLLLIFHT